MIADTMSLPGNFDWDSAIVRVAEKDVSRLDARLDAITPAEEEQLRSNCMKAAHTFLQNNLVSCVRDQYDAAPRAA